MATSPYNTAISESVHKPFTSVKEKNAERDDWVSHEYSGAGDLFHPVFEDYLHYAAIQRLKEDGIEVERVTPEMIKEKRNWFSRLSEHKGPNVNVNVRHVIPRELTPDEEERENASRALRLAGWAAVFYLITTDILGPFNAPFAISQVGWVPGMYV